MKKSKKLIEKEINNIKKKIYGCCNGIRKLLAKQGCDSVISNAVIYSLCNDLCSDDINDTVKLVNQQPIELYKI